MHKWGNWYETSDSVCFYLSSESFQLCIGKFGFSEVWTNELWKIDTQVFQGIDLARKAGNMGGTMPIVLNAANEIAVDFSWKKRYGFRNLWSNTSSYGTISEGGNPILGAYFSKGPWGKGVGKNMGKIIVIEGTDSSGKETQSHLLLEHFLSLGRKARRLSFPNYESPACEPVKMYLAGEFGLNAEKVNPYPVSTMYAIDRYASYQKDWGYDYQQEESIFVADRYVTSNMIHQASKLEGKEKKSI